MRPRESAALYKQLNSSDSLSCFVHIKTQRLILILFINSFRRFFLLFLVTKPQFIKGDESLEFADRLILAVDLFHEAGGSVEEGGVLFLEVVEFALQF